MVHVKWVGVVSVVSLAIAVGCNNNPVANKPIAEVQSAAQVTERPAEASVAYAFSEVGSQVTFVGAKITGKHDGAFGKFSGTVSLVGNDPTKSHVRAEIDTASLSADQEKLTGHLKSPDFFDVEHFPKAVFQSTKIENGGQVGASHTVTGNLELHGVTKSIRFPAVITVTHDSVTVKSEFGINRKDFGVVYPGKPDDLIKDEVLIRLNLTAQKA